jgi:hypothetical protein
LIKPTLEAGFDHRSLAWRETQPTALAPHALEEVA